MDINLLYAPGLSDCPHGRQYLSNILGRHLSQPYQARSETETRSFCKCFMCFPTELRTFLQSSNSQPWVLQIFLNYSSQESWPAQLAVKASGSFSPRTSGDPTMGTTALEEHNFQLFDCRQCTYCKHCSNVLGCALFTLLTSISISQIMLPL